MTRDPIPAQPVATLECRSCGAGAPVDEHFCPQCSRILGLGRHGDYFSFLGLPRRLVINQAQLERRVRDLSRQFHPDYFYNAAPAERLASLERSSYLNDAYRALRNPISRIEHLLAIEGLPPAKSEDGTAKVPPGLLEEVFELNEQLDEIRESRESGGDPAALRERLESARKPIDLKREEHEREVEALSVRWDQQAAASPAEKRATLDALRERLLERNYINNLLATIDRECAVLSAQSPVHSPGTSDPGREPKTVDRGL
ncbi:MAG TPA: Fe-S protein assembly co-chaperone HscB [Casimicrobiaceae bacterium]|nr:Fe-S protein assembly co-chaperone HscB [Casimicrobiaceae bacterium]